MNGYKIPKDGKIHTHFSELMRCTPGQIHSVLNERAGFKKPYSSPGMDFGHERHEMWAEEALRTGKTPEVFLSPSANFQVSAELVEKELASEIFPGIVLHSRIDTYGDRTVVDYKTTAMSYSKAQDLYNRSIQLKIYAYQLMIHDKPVDKMVYLIEHWDRELQNILSYSKIEKPYLPRYINEARSWLLRRCEVLLIGLEQARKDGIDV